MSSTKVLAYVLSGVTAHVFAQSPNPETILQLAADAYGQRKSYQLEVAVVSQTITGDSKTTMESSMTIVAQQPNRFRVDAKGFGNLTVSDGAHLWSLSLYRKEYMQAPARDSLFSALAGTAASRILPFFPGGTRSVRLAGEETLTVGSSSHQCYVLEMESRHDHPTPSKVEESPAKLWIDQKTYLVLSGPPSST